MGIFDALTTAVTGLQGQAFALQNISGNIANSQTTAFKGTGTSFQDLVSGSSINMQVSGSLTTSSRATNDVQGALQTSQIPTDMAINGAGYFVVAKPSNFTDNQPVFNGVDLYTRRGDFSQNSNGYLVNSAGYYLMGITVDPKTGNPTGSVPQVLQFSNSFMPAQATTAIQYQSNLPSYPLTTNATSTVVGSELLNPTAFTANPLAGVSPFAKITGVGASIKPDAPAVQTGTQNLASLSATGGTLDINGQTITIVAGQNMNQVLTDFNGVGPAFAIAAASGVTASLNGSNQLVLTSKDASTNIAIGNASSLAELTELGLGTPGTTNATNLITQNAVAAGETLAVTIGGSTSTITFGIGGTNVATLAQLAGANGLGKIPGSAGTGSVDFQGNITITAAVATDTVSVTGSATPAVFGIQNTTALPASGTVIANDTTSFLNETVSGGSVTAYDSTGAPVNMQFRWAKVSSVAKGGADTWQLFYQTNSHATGNAVAWKNAGTSFTFNSSGQLSPAIANLTLANATVNGTSLGNVVLNFGANGLTQFAASSGAVQVNTLQQNGFAAGQLQSIAVDTQNRVTGTFTNGQTIPLAEVSLAVFAGQDSLQALNGGAYAQTAESGSPNFSATGKIAGSSLEASNVDIADQFAHLIVAQQAYSANAKVMTTANQMVQSLLAVVQ